MKKLYGVQCEILNKILGYSGIILNATKSNPDIIYNANLLTKEHGVIWYGDIPFKKEKILKDLKMFAEQLGEDLYILREMDARFKEFKYIDLNKAILIIKSIETVLWKRKDLLSNLVGEIMETLVTDFEKPAGQKLIDADNMKNDNIFFNLFEEYSFLIYLEKIKNGIDILE